MTRRRACALLVLLVVSGCSQVAALAPVGGNRLAEVRFAALDVLLDAEVELLTAPVCAAPVGDEVECVGSTVDGTAVTVMSPAGETFTMTVRIGDEILYAGPVRDVLDRAAEGGRTEPTP